MNTNQVVSNWEGDSDALKEVLGRMKERLTKRANEIQETLNNGDLVALAFIAHKCKFSAKYIFAKELVTKIELVEEACQQKNIDLVRSRTKDLIIQMNTEAQEIDQFCK